MTLAYADAWGSIRDSMGNLAPIEIVLDVSTRSPQLRVVAGAHRVAGASPRLPPPLSRCGAARARALDLLDRRLG